MRLLLYARNATSQTLTLAQWHGRRNETAIKLQNQRFTRTSYPARSTKQCRSEDTIATRRLCLLSGATPAGSQFANMVQEDRPLQRIELRGVMRNLSQEGVGHQHRRLIPMPR